MRFLADEQQGRDAVAPQAEIERHAAQHRDHGIDDLRGEAGELHDRHRPAVGGQAEQMADHFRHGVAADIGIVEHEGVARIVLHGVDARDQLVIDDARGAVLQLAHALVDQRDQVLQPVRHRRVDGVADLLGIDPLQADAVGVLVLRVDALRHRNHFGEDVELLGHAGTAGEQHVDDFLEVEQPERQFQVARVEHQRALAEAAAIFVVDVEQEDAQVRPRFQDFVQQQRHAGRLADAGRAEHGEMLGQHFLDVDIGDDGAVLLQRADIDLVGAGGRIDRAKLLAGDQVDGVADGRIVGDAALEFRPVAAEDFAEQVDAGRGDIGVGGRHVLGRHVRDHGDDGRGGAADADELADGASHFRKWHLAVSQQSDPGEGASYRNHASE